MTLRLWSVSLVLAVSTAASAQTDSRPLDYEQLRKTVEQLKHERYDKREEASRRLAELITHRNVNTLEVFLEDSRITSEQRFRLLEVYRDKTINRPSGALGIRMDMVDRGGGGPQVVALIPGMPASKVLKIGDRIRRIDGIPVQSNQKLIQIVQTKSPGDRVLLTVDREKRKPNGLPDFDINNRLVFESVQVELVLGSVAQLDAVNGDGRTSDRFLENRILQAEEASLQHAPLPVEITISNRQAMFEAIVNRSSESSEVDDHPIIQIMLDDADRILNGGQKITQADREKWDSFMRQISREFVNPKNRKRDQDYLIKVTKRYQDLLRRITSAPDASAFSDRP